MSNFIRNKPELIRRAEGHRKADRLNQGTYFTRFTDTVRARLDDARATGDPQLISKNHVGLCAVACLATPLDDLNYVDRGADEYGRSYGTLERDFGIPKVLTGLADNIFEGLSKRKAKRWPEQFARALPRRSITAADVRRWKHDHRDLLVTENYTAIRNSLLRWLREGK